MSPNPEPEERGPSAIASGQQTEHPAGAASEPASSEPVSGESASSERVSGASPSGSDATGAETGTALAPSEGTSNVTVEDEYPPEWDPGGGGAPPPAGAERDRDEAEPPEFGKMSFLDHLEELRKRIIHSLIAIAVGFGVCWWGADWLYAALAMPLTQTLRELRLDDQLVYTNPTAPFTLYVQLALVAGIFVASPYLIWQVWRFISPGLYPHERRYAIPFVFLCSVLFLAGGTFAYAIAFPATLRFLLNFASQFRPMITVNEYFSLAMTIILGLAVVFELPVLILLLTLLRIITPRFLIRNFRYAVLLIFITAAVITPTPDVPTMMLFSAPLIALYFLGVGLSSLVLRLRRRKEES